MSGVEDFVRQTEVSIRRTLRDRAAPVILVGSPLLRRFYRNACGHGHLVSEEVASIFGVHERRAIHKATWSIAQQELSRRSGRIVSSYQRLVGTSQTSDSLDELAAEGVV